MRTRNSWIATTLVVTAVLATIGSGAGPAGASSTTGQLIYVNATANQPWQLMTTSPEGGPGTPLFADPATMYFSPSAAPRGRKLAFAWLVTSVDASHIGTYDLDAGGQPTLFDAGSTSWHDDHPTWNRAGTLIAFARSTSTTDEIWLMNADGSNQRKVPGAVGTNPVFSPSGQQIVFESTAGTPALMTVNIDGSGLAPLAGGAGGQAPNWSPDGQTIVFSKSPSPNAPTMDLYRLDAAGGTAAKITTGLAGKSALTSFSPDSHTIYFSNVDATGTTGHVFSAPVTGGAATQITTGLLDIEPAISAPLAPGDTTGPGTVTPPDPVVTPPGATAPTAGKPGTPPSRLPDGPLISPISLRPGTRPSSAAGINAQTSRGVVLLMWKNPRDKDFAGVVVTRDGKKVYDGRATRLLDRVAAGSLHSYVVTAYDASGNRGAPVRKSIRALAPPAIRVARPSLLSSRSVTLRVSWSADAGVKDYTVQYAYKRWTGKAWVLTGFRPWLSHTRSTGAVFGARGLPRTVPPGSTFVFRAYATSTLGDPTSYSPSALVVVPAVRRSRG
jgi:hypothetical protein